MDALEAEPISESSQETGPTQSQKAEKENHALPPNNLFVPPTGDTCYINNLPPELLSRIFEVGALDDGSDDEDDEDDGGADFRVQGGPEEGNKSGADNDVEMAKLEEEEDGDDEEWTDVTGPSDFDSPSPSFQIVVSHVCRHWRNVALSTPSLWTTIEVPSDVHPPYENVSVMLERSKALPIDIYIDHDLECDADSVDGGAPSEHDLKFLSSLLVPHVQRWRLIKVEASSYHQMYAFLSAVSDPSVPAPSQLATLRLYHLEDMAEFQTFGHPNLSNHFTLFGGSAPNLTELILWGVHVDWNQSWIASASNLRYLELAYHTEDVRPTWAQFATIMCGAPQLEALQLFMSGPSGEPTELVFESTPGRPIGDLDAPIQLLKLTQFVLAFQPPSRAIGLFRKFYMPSLTTLTLKLPEGDHSDLIDQLAGPATSLSPLSESAQEQPRSVLSSLEELSIIALPCSTQSVETLYSALQNLQSLNISKYLPPQFVDLLCRPCTLPGRGDIWLPRLKCLWISGTTGDMIRQLVQKRKDAGIPLEALYVEQSCVLGDDDDKWFRENVELFHIFEGNHDMHVIDIDGPDEEGESVD